DEGALRHDHVGRQANRAAAGVAPGQARGGARRAEPGGVPRAVGHRQPAGGMPARGPDRAGVRAVSRAAQAKPGTGRAAVRRGAARRRGPAARAVSRRGWEPGVIKRLLLPLVAGAVVVAVVYSAGSLYQIFLLTGAAITVVIMQSYGLITGRAGVISLCQMSF